MGQFVTIRYFAWLRERIGTPEEAWELPSGSVSVADLVGMLASRGPAYAAAFANRRTIRCAVNREFADPATVLRPGDEVAFFPPVTGG